VAPERTHSLELALSAPDHAVASGAAVGDAAAAAAAAAHAGHAHPAATRFAVQLMAPSPKSCSAEATGVPANDGSQLAAVWGWNASLWGPFVHDADLGFGSSTPQDGRAGKAGRQGGAQKWGGELWEIVRIRDAAFELWSDRVRRVCPAAAEGQGCRREKRERQAECGGHGRCDAGSRGSGWCFCHGDWFGQHCEYHPFLNSSFLPPSSLLADPSRCARAQQWTMASGALVASLDRLQHTRCSRADSVLLDTLGLALGGQVIRCGWWGGALAHTHRQGERCLSSVTQSYAFRPHTHTHIHFFTLTNMHSLSTHLFPRPRFLSSLHLSLPPTLSPRSIWPPSRSRMPLSRDERWYYTDAGDTARAQPAHISFRRRLEAQGGGRAGKGRSGRWGEDASVFFGRSWGVLIV